MDKSIGFAEVNGAQLYYEVSGEGTPFVMIHAGIADSRMWDSEFSYFADQYKVIRFDMRGYGKSKPVDGEFNIQDDFEVLLNELNVTDPIILMGCSIGAGLAIDFVLTHPQKVQSLILVGGAPAGLELDSDDPDDLFEASEKAFNAGNLDHAAELDMQIWFDGVGRAKEDVDTTIRQKAYKMARLVLDHDALSIGKHVRKEFDKPVVERLDELTMPTLILIGENDIEFLRLSAGYMEEHMPNSTLVWIPDAAHLPNMEQPETFQQTIASFLQSGAS